MAASVSLTSHTHLLKPRDVTNDVAETRQIFTMLLQMYDHILTFRDEVNLIWRKLNVVSVVFLLNRYITPVMISSVIWGRLNVYVVTINSCKVRRALYVYLTLFSLESFHYIAALRVYALYGGQRWIGRLLLISGTVYFLSTMAVSTSVVISLMRHIRVVHSVCTVKDPTAMWSLWLPTVIFEIILFWLTLRIAIRQARTASTYCTLQHLLVRDEILYFSAVFLCSLFSLVCASVAPNSRMAELAENFTVTLSLAFVNVAGSRLVLNIKMHLAHESEMETTLQSDRSPVVFQKPAHTLQIA